MTAHKRPFLNHLLGEETFHQLNGRSVSIVGFLFVYVNGDTLLTAIAMLNLGRLASDGLYLV